MLLGILDGGVKLSASNGDKCFYQGQEVNRLFELTFLCAEVGHFLLLLLLLLFMFAIQSLLASCCSVV